MHKKTDAEILGMALELQDIIRATYETKGGVIPLAIVWTWLDDKERRLPSPVQSTITPDNAGPYSAFLDFTHEFATTKEGVGGIMVRVEPKGLAKSIVIQARLTTGGDRAWRAPLDPTKPRYSAIGAFAETAAQPEMRVLPPTA